MTTTEEWAASLDIPSGPDVPPVEGYSRPYGRSARQVAIRAIILQGVAAVGCGVDAGPVVDWFKGQKVWRNVSPTERAFLLASDPSEGERNQARWRQEAEWALLWVVGKVQSLGLPTRCCDTHRLVEEIIPPLGSDIRPFIETARLRPPGVLLGEDDRTYRLWCATFAARRRRQRLPEDLNLQVLYERRYAFEWLDGNDAWDEVTCDA
jgi:hypothetical protein